MLNHQYLEFSDAGESVPDRFSELEENAFWSSHDECELRVHRIHAYPAKFPAFITTKALEFAEKSGVKVRTIGDVFCGCGTVAFEARRNGINFWGCDINPVATLIATVKSNSYSQEKLESYYKRIMARFPRAKSSVKLADTAAERLDYWYSKAQAQDLARLLNAITYCVPSGSAYRKFFLCAFSNILKPTSRWLTKSIKPQVDPHKKPIRVKDAFTEQVGQMSKAWGQVRFPPKGSVQIVTGNVLELVPPTKIDMLVTSPPYVTSYEYADLHQLSSLWLGFASDYRDLRRGSIGSTQHELDFNRGIKRLNKVGAQVVFSLFDRDRGIARSTAKYFLDMQSVAGHCFHLLGRRGLAVFVIGNTEYKGVRVENAAHLTESLLASGFARVKVAKRRMSGKILTPYRDKIGQFSRSSAGRHVYAEEFVLIASK